jgi:hypothetical protein
MNTQTQGNIALGIAIQYYTRKENVVSLPLNDCQDYDLIIDCKGVLKKVQVKSTRHKSRSGFFKAELKTSGGNSGRILKTFDQKDCDILFVATASGEVWEIPINEISNKNSITLSKQYDKFKVELKANY